MMEPFSPLGKKGLEVFSTEDLITELRNRCEGLAIGARLPTNSETECVIITWGKDYYQSFGLAHGIIHDMKMSVDPTYCDDGGEA